MNVLGDFGARKPDENEKWADSWFFHFIVVIENGVETII